MKTVKQDERQSKNHSMSSANAIQAPIKITIEVNDIPQTLDIESCIAKIRADLTAAQEWKEKFVRTYTIGARIESTIIISSTFSANSIIAPLSQLLQKFSSAEVVLTYNDFSQQLLNLNSQFHTNKRGMNVLLFRFEDWCNKQYGIEALQDNLHEIKQWIEQYKATSETPLLLFCCPSSSLSAYPTIEQEFFNFILEKRLAYLVQENDIQQYFPVDERKNPFSEKEAHMPYTLKCYTALGEMIARIYFNLSTSPKKVIVLDCDDTLWKGKIGEDGLQGIKVDESRRIFQRFLIEKSKQGFVLCLCSRNNEEDVWNVFIKSEKMILKKENITDWRINWKKKSENIIDLSISLGLGLDSFIFIDDDPAQIGEVSISCPEVLSLQLPKEDELIPIFFNSIWGLENFIQQEGLGEARTKYYQNNTKRNALKNTASTFTEYLKQLNLKTTIRLIEERDYPRVAELMQRSNQFNFNKWSLEDCSEAKLKKLINNEYQCLVVEVEDRYDNYGLVGLMLFRFVGSLMLLENFILSCRALGKGVEYRMLSEFSKQLETYQQDKIYIIFKPSQKNEPAFTFLKEASFALEGEGQAIYSLPVSIASSITPPEWTGETQTGQVTYPVTDNATVVSQNKFVKKMIDRALSRYKGRESNSQAASFSNKIDSVNDSLEYIKHLITQLGLPASDDEDATFFEVGFDSTLAVHFTSMLYQNLKIYLSYYSLLSPGYTLKECAKTIYNEISGKEKPSILFKKSTRGLFLLSREQQRLWSFYCQYPESSKYNMSITYQLEGKLSLEAMQAAFFRILKYETVFCLSLTGDLNHPVQEIDHSKLLHFNWQMQKREGYSLNLVEKEVEQFVHQPFNLKEDLLLRVQILQLAEQQYILTLCVPHIIHDAVSLNLLLARLAKYYSAILHDTNDYQDENTYQYTDYIEWQQNESIEEKRLNEVYWQSQLAGKSSPRLPIIKNAAPSQISKRAPFTVDRDITKQLEALAVEAQATTYEVLLTIFSILLSKYMGHLDTLILIPTAGRQHPNTRQIIGFFVNLILLSHHLNEEYNFFQSVTEVQKLLHEGVQHQDYPFLNMLSLLDNSDCSLPISFIFQNYDEAVFPLEAIEVKRVFSENNSIIYDMALETRLGPLAMFMRKESDKLSGIIEYDEALFTENVIEQLISHFQCLIIQIIQHPNHPVLSHSLLTEAEKEKILTQWNHSVNLNKNYLDILSIFRSQVDQHPDHIAVYCENNKLTYSELDKKSTQLGLYLKSQLNLTYEDCIAVCLPRDCYEAIALLAILKAGCAYVPINAHDPTERIQYILQDTNSKAILVTDKGVPFVHDIPTIAIDKDELFNHLSVESVNCKMANPSQLAYVMYTSGSTGVPKGVLINQESITRLVVLPNYMEFNAEDRIAQLSNASFDAATLEFWGGLLNGATLIYPEQGIIYDINLFSKFLSDRKITILWLTAALFEEFTFLEPAMFRDLNYLLSGGDRLNPKAVNAVFNCVEGRPKHLLNGYGPTENTTFSTVFEIQHEVHEGEGVPIGSPIQGTEIYVLDAQQQPVPVGIHGFLYVGGAGLARGYLNNPELTESKFLEIKILGVTKRLYSTGDIVYWHRDGTLGYVGRVDHQVKLRGYRVDLGEIEVKLLQIPEIKQVAVIMQEGNLLDQKRLIAHFVARNASQTLDLSEVKKRLQASLPDYMLPDHLIPMDQLPITVNGKIDRHALTRSFKTEIKNPVLGVSLKTPVEKKLIELVMDVAGIAMPQPIDLFRELSSLGINSLSLIRLLHKIKDAFGVRFSAPCIMQNSIHQLAELIEKKNMPTSLTVSDDYEHCVIQIRAGNPKKTSIVFIHPAGGATYCYKHLLDDLEQDLPCYVIEDVSLLRKKTVGNSIPEIAAYYLQLIKRQMPEYTTIILSGWSFGGMVAVEMALQNSLEQSKKIEIKGIILLDTWVVSQLATETSRAFKQKVIDQYRSSYDNQVEPYLLDIFVNRQEQGFTYEPAMRVNTPILLCKAQDTNNLINMVDRENYWGRFADNLEVLRVEGDHDTMLNADYTKKLAKIITSYIASKSLSLSSPTRASFWQQSNIEMINPTESRTEYNNEIKLG